MPLGESTAASSKGRRPRKQKIRDLWAKLTLCAHKPLILSKNLVFLEQLEPLIPSKTLVKPAATQPTSPLKSRKSQQLYSPPALSKAARASRSTARPPSQKPQEPAALQPASPLKSRKSQPLHSPSALSKAHWPPLASLLSPTSPALSQSRDKPGGRASRPAFLGSRP